MPALSEKQKRFVAEYLIDLNATQAAIRAGYSKKTATVQASRLLTNAKVQKELSGQQKKVAERLEVTKDRIVDELAKIGFANMLDYVSIGTDGDPFVDLSDMTRDQAAAVSEITVEDFKDGRGEEARDVRKVKFKLHDKKGALMDLAKMLGHVVEKQEHSGSINLNVSSEDANL